MTTHCCNDNFDRSKKLPLRTLQLILLRSEEGVCLGGCLIGKWSLVLTLCVMTELPTPSQNYQQTLIQESGVFLTDHLLVAVPHLDLRLLVVACSYLRESSG